MRSRTPTVMLRLPFNRWHELRITMASRNAWRFCECGPEDIILRGEPPA
jgi:hypothetical protein